MASKKKWIKAATENSHGQFKAKAEAAGKSTKEFAQEKRDAPGKVGKQARLALALMGASKNTETKKKTRPSGDVRKALYGSKE